MKHVLFRRIFLAYLITAPLLLLFLELYLSSSIKDNYISKPQIGACLQAKSVEKPFSEKILKVGELEIDRERYTVSLKGEPVKLSATEFKLLLFLAERKGKVFSRDQLLDAVWRDEAFVEPRTVDVHVRRLRSQIEDDPAHPRYVKTMRGIGYSFSDK